VQYLRRSVDRLGTAATYGPKVFALLVQGQQRLGHREEAMVICRAGRTRYPTENELRLLEGILLQETGDLTGAEACLLAMLPAQPGQAVSRADQEIQKWARHHLASIRQQRASQPPTAVQRSLVQETL